ncbi:MAG TPA: ribose-phosphate pyrophosphokinase [Clostridiales bacterium]|jgi:ribose-phosphate pyrophosphokinase|nr:ribose-phosphate pyrophosphokinase [Clostridiales bacterium]
MEELHNLPVGNLALVGMRGCEELVSSIDSYLVNWRKAVVEKGLISNAILDNFNKDSYLIDVRCPRFGTGEAKGMINESVRGDDLFIICDCFNHGVTYKMYGKDVPMSPDDHFQDLKRIISATAGKTRRITVIMPMLYESRQHRRSARESLDCALALQELVNMGVHNILTFDAHDPRVQNAIPHASFETVPSTYQMIKALVNNIDDLEIDRDNLMIISPDEGGMGRCIYYSSVMGIDLGMFYKRRDYSTIVNGRNPIIAHEFLGSDVDGKDVIIVDDMIASGESTLDIARQLKARNARRIFACSTFGLFVDGLDAFDDAYEQGLIAKVFTTNAIYRTPELKQREWYCEVDISKYIALIVNTLNHDRSISKLLDASERVKNFLTQKGYKIPR